MSGYNAPYWSKRIPQYLAADWSYRPTPFAKLAAGYFPLNGCILELGAGAGQDSLWFASQGFDITMTDGDGVGFQEIQKRAKQSKLSVKTRILDITNEFLFKPNSFGGVYAQLVLNYFNDETTHSIMKEIDRVLMPGGVFACMVNSTKDREYETAKVNQEGLINVNGLMKRYFSMATFAPFVADFEELLFNEEGRTPKDNSVGTKGMIQFIGRKR